MPISSATEKAAIFLIGDRPLCIHGMAQLISTHPGWVVCGEAVSLDRALLVLDQTEASAVVLDIFAAAAGTMDAVKRLHAAKPNLPILVVGAHSDAAHALRALRAGAKGFVTKIDGVDQFVAALRKVMSGQVYLSSAFSEQVIADLANNREDQLRSGIDRLSEREIQVLRLVGEGLMTREIATRLSLSAKTVETHRQRIKEKLGIRSAPELLRFAIEWIGGT